MKKLLYIFISIILFNISCNKSQPTTKEPVNNQRKIKKSLIRKIHDDNVNVNMRISSGSLIESISFYYNTENNLDRMYIYNDTSANANLIAIITVHYYNNMVKLMPLSFPSANLSFIFDNQKRVRVITSNISTDSVLFNYSNNNQINDIKVVDSAGIIHHHFDFVYTTDNNLTTYKTNSRNVNTGTMQTYLKYYTEYNIRNEFDSRFYREETRFFHLGGINTIYMLGMNYGKPTKNALKERIERTPTATGDSLTRSNTFNYVLDNYNDIIKRQINGPYDSLEYQFIYEK